jgi:hypothetical protein
VKGIELFEKFREVYEPQRDAIPAGPAWSDAVLDRVVGYPEFVSEFGGASFAGGLYRVHDAETGRLGAQLVRQAFPDAGARAHVFGYDWLGRQFAIDEDRMVHGEPQVLMLDVGAGEMLQVPASFVGFHEFELIEYPDASLAPEFFSQWAATAPGEIPLKRSAAVSYRIPLFLNGADTLENLELSDMDVMWTITGQLRVQLMGL